jgi:hypothetical protein
MKKVIIFVLSLHSLVACSQSFEGVYTGSILSEKNVFVLSVLGEIAVGTIYLDKSEKFIFSGSVRNSKLEGIARKDTQILELVGEVMGDSLFLTIKRDNGTVKSKLVRASKDPKSNPGRYLNQKSTRDPALVGKWVFLETKDLNGRKRPPDKLSEGFSYIFNADGSCIVRSRALDAFFSEKKALPPKSTWEVIGNRLTITTGDLRPMTTEESYLIRGDTLITQFRESISVFIRYQQKKKKG